VVNRNGTVTIQGSTISGNGGVGVLNLGEDDGHASMTLTQSTIAGNSGAGVTNWSYHGAADVAVIQSLIADNRDRGVSNSTRAKHDDHASATLIQSTIAGNTGGGVSNGGWYRASMTLIQSTITGNTAAVGGGVVNEGGYGSDYYGRFRGTGRLTLLQSTIASNTAIGPGGGVLNRADTYGGATLTLTNSTISGNMATRGGGILNTADREDSRITATVLQSTITSNTATDDGGGILSSTAIDLSNITLALTLAGSLVIGNLAPTAPEVLHRGGTLTANAFNLFGASGSAGVFGFPPGPSDRVPTEPLTAILDPVLADHGGPTLTHALVPGSPALNAIPWGANGCGTTLISDQRGQARPDAVGGACDIGADEGEVAGQALGAWVSGVTPHTVTCTNVTAGHEVTLSPPAAAWDCKAAGLEVSVGDRVSLLARGPVQQGATDVGGAVVGMAPTSGGCANLTTGQQVPFQHMVGATEASCAAAGLVVQPGDRVHRRVRGVAE
jgi:predicted outer membrane repeat protein